MLRHESYVVRQTGTSVNLTCDTYYVMIDLLEYAFAVAQTRSFWDCGTAGYGVLYMIEIDPGSKSPVYRQIVEQVRLGIATAQLKPGDSLETVRGMGERLQINPSTVARAFRLLEHDGVIQTNRRGGSRIAGRV
jgi:hypothetical protein